MTQKVQIHQQHRNCKSGYSSVKQSGRYVTHGLYGCAAHWQQIMCSAGHMGHGSLHWDGMDRWAPLPSFSTYASPHHCGTTIL